MGFKPVLHRLFVRPDDVLEADDAIKSAKAAGIVIELDKREQKAVCTGTVVSIGNTAFIGFQSTPEGESIKPGSKVIYAKYSGADVPNSDLILLNDEDILGVEE